MLTTETRIDGKTVYKGKIIDVCVDEVRLPDGKKCIREEIKHGGGACVLAIDNGEIILVSQFRYAFGKELIEVPAGKLNPGEEPLETAGREFIEETGLKATDIRPLAKIFPSAGYTNEIIYAYYATKFVVAKQNLDEGEFLNVIRMKVEDFIELIDSGKICDGKTLICGLYLKNMLANNEFDK